MTDDREKLNGETGTDQPVEVAVDAPEADPAAAAPADNTPPGSVQDVPTPDMSDEMRRALEDAAEAVAQKSAPSSGDAPFDPNRPAAPAEPPPHEPSKKEMELKMQILDLRSQLREKDKEIEQRLKEVKQNAESARMYQGQIESYKARVMREKADWFNYGHEPILKELLQVVDNLERALSHAGKDADPAAICTGVEMIQRQMVTVLAKFGATPVDSKGGPFNPELHQAMSQVENDAVPAGTVVEEFQKAYKLKDRLLRPAMVLVSRRSAAAEAAAKAGQAEKIAATESDPDNSAGGD